MNVLLAFLAAFLPKAKPYIDRAPGLIVALRGAFTKVGGKGEDLETILAKNQIDIDRLGDPDSFRTVPKKKGKKGQA